ncbi:Protein HIRA [Entamoeba marina]
MVRFARPLWVSHEGCPIFSVDAHPSLDKFVTGGADGTFKVWSSLPLHDNTITPKQLSVVKVGDVINICRWSPNGEFLAVGGDNKTVSIWKCQQHENDELIEDDSGNVNCETYVNIANLRGHIDSITDISWSPTSDRLASASLDNTVIVWDINKKELITTLREHSTCVYGVVWDPLDHFILSQDANAALFYDCETFKVDRKITAPFLHSTHGNFSCRPSWSPDGARAILVGATNKSKHTAVVVQRQTDEHVHFQCHRNEIVCSRYSPRGYSYINNENKRKVFSVFATGGLDCGTSLWTSKANDHTSCFISSVFDNSLQDAAWLNTGKTLLLVGLDGFLAAIDFSVEEIGGEVVKRGTWEKYLKKIKLQEDEWITKHRKEREQKEEESRKRLNTDNTPQAKKKGDENESEDDEMMKISLVPKQRKITKTVKPRQQISNRPNLSERTSSADFLDKINSLEKSNTRQFNKSELLQKQLDDLVEKINKLDSTTSTRNVSKPLLRNLVVPQPKPLSIIRKTDNGVSISYKATPVTYGRKMYTTIKCIRTQNDHVFWESPLPYEIILMTVNENNMALVSREGVVMILSLESGSVVCTPTIICNNIHNIFLNASCLNILKDDGVVMVYDFNLNAIKYMNIEPILERFVDRDVTNIIYSTETNGINIILDHEIDIYAQHGNYKIMNHQVVDEERRRNITLSEKHKFENEVILHGLLTLFNQQLFEETARNYFKTLKETNDIQRLATFVNILEQFQNHYRVSCDDFLITYAKNVADDLEEPLSLISQICELRQLPFEQPEREDLGEELRTIMKSNQAQTEFINRTLQLIKDDISKSKVEQLEKTDDKDPYKSVLVENKEETLAECKTIRTLLDHY